jgi:hypothetical protein
MIQEPFFSPPAAATEKEGELYHIRVADVI